MSPDESRETSQPSPSMRVRAKVRDSSSRGTTDNDCLVRSTQPRGGWIHRGLVVIINLRVLGLSQS